MKNLLLFLSFILILGACTSPNQPKTIYIVRHAEKQLVGEDPDLAYVGGIRAKKLAQILEDQDIKHVFSTDYKRTRSTVEPTASAAGVEIQIYDPKNHDGLVEQLRKLEGNALVVGHSNTVSQLANYFVSDGEKFADLTDLEYDFIYVVKLESNSSSVERKVYKDFN
ncbi:MAG: phosphoglycerate mutase family protein [Algoriphagus sp.]|uniref:SixA phosphatase family protein n=1 Tax=Algoriphagus sp. TaxID=1872435 RepID=UPI002731ECCF|nr:phosphoglycerate mutase family protein [Algoriphagus sp.]MDP2041098.1 phosphoglycerate mutase family protein [Algoriphagus sp.]MDP3472290.1 phosphoglycerate mutase family protein [Algoriphagus sp.]